MPKQTPLDTSMEFTVLAVFGGNGMKLREEPLPTHCPQPNPLALPPRTPDQDGVDNNSDVAKQNT